MDELIPAPDPDRPRVAWILLEVSVDPQTRTVGRLWLAGHLFAMGCAVLCRAKVFRRSHRAVFRRDGEGVA
jgi:hypothetical protein